jgi:hypothetical protein
MEKPVTSIFLVEDDPEDGGNRFLGNNSIYLTDDMVYQVLFITCPNKSMYDLIFQGVFQQPFMK